MSLWLCAQRLLPAAIQSAADAAHSETVRSIRGAFAWCASVLEYGARAALSQSANRG